MPYGGSAKNPFRNQFEGNLVDETSFSVTPILYLNGDGDILPIHATGFIVKEGGRNFLVSAYHCLTGKNPATGENSSSTGHIPSRIRIFPTAKRDGVIQRLVFEFEIIDNILFDPNFEIFRTDIAAIELECDDELVTAASAEEILHTTVGSQCFVVGFPLPNTNMPHIPIWRRASFATDPMMAINGKPLFYIDAFTSPGMSGSPIFQRVFGPTAHYADGELQIAMDRVLTTRLVGVYAGRIQDYQAAGPIGYGWYENRIKAIITQQHTDSAFDLGLGSISF